MPLISYFSSWLVVFVTVSKICGIRVPHFFWLKTELSIQVYEQSECNNFVCTRRLSWCRKIFSHWYGEAGWSHRVQNYLRSHQNWLSCQIYAGPNKNTKHSRRKTVSDESFGLFCSHHWKRLFIHTNWSYSIGWGLPHKTKLKSTYLVLVSKPK